MNGGVEREINFHVPFGGIHPLADDFPARRTGSQCGQGVWALAQKYLDGSVTQTPITLAIRPLNPTQCELRFNTLRGFFYKLQSTPDLGQAFADEPGGFAQAFDTAMLRADGAGGQKFYRVVGAPAP